MNKRPMKKQRGLRRKCRNMVRRITEQTATFPQAHKGANFWHLHLPVARDFISSGATPFKVRRLCAQTLIDRAHHLAALAPSDGGTRIVVAISPEDLWDSQIIVFFGSQYFDSFFKRDLPEQTWTTLNPNRSLQRCWNLELPADFGERGYQEEINAEDFQSQHELWFIGQLAD